MRAIACGRQAGKAEAPSDATEPTDVRGSDQDVDVAGSAVELGFAAQQAPRYAPLVEGLEQRSESRMDLRPVR